MEPLIILLVVAVLVVLVLVIGVLAVVWRGRQGAGELARFASEQSNSLSSARLQVEAVLAAEREELQARRAGLDNREARVLEQEEQLTNDRAVMRNDAAQVHRDRMALTERERSLAERQEAAIAELERISGLSAEQARAELLAVVERDSRHSALLRAREIEAEARRDADRIARDIVATTIQRIAAEQTSESVVSTVELPSDELKGRIIGREGRNIRAFEQVTGVNVMIDDTPGSVLLSCFDPVRRETARLTLTELVADGRIHPARIEEVYERSKSRVAEFCVRAAEDALAELGITDLDPSLTEIVGALRFRTSYGQNVLAHMVECGRIAGLIAAELGLNVQSCRRAAFLHDIGKGFTASGEGSHALEGADLARRHGERPEIVNAIASHHSEVPQEYVESVIAQAADAISGSRPGARRESLENYVHRLERLEKIAGAHQGVDRVFAMQAGREVRVMVCPELVDDAESYALARDIAHEVETELTYPGNIRITVVRESRATELAR